MKRIGLFACMCAALSTQSAFAQRIKTVDNVSPIKYEKRDGTLQIKSYALLDEAPKTKLSFLLNGKSIIMENSNRKDSLLFWMPLIGKDNILTVKAGKQKIADYNIASPINSDWGYFANGTIHIIQSSHQDIAWMNTPEYCRTERINDIITPALDMMKEDPDFTFEMEQTLNLMEYLEAHPERKDEVIQRYKEGRFFWGATYNQPYEGLSSGEQLVRQTYYGRKWIKENLPGCDDRTANNIDVPGRTMQMAQIFAKSGIDNLFISRMREGLYNWYSPDGSKVFTYTPGNYGWASLMWKFFDSDAVFAMNKLHTRLALWDAYFTKHNIPPHYAVLMSCDATKPRNFREIINEWNKIVELSEIPLPKLTNSTAEKYFELVNTPESKLESVSGERPNLWLYIHGPAHYQETCAKREAGVVLPAAEMFSSIANYRKSGEANYPKATFDRAWIASIYPDHGLGGKNGAITDSIFADSLNVAKRLGETLLNGALEDIAQNVKGNEGDLVIFNDLTWNRTDVVAMPTQYDDAIVKDYTGKVVNSQVVNKNGTRTLVFVAEDIPSAGYKLFNVSPAKRRNKSKATISQGDNFCENNYYRIVLGDGGMVSMYDKELKKDVLQNEKYAGGDIMDALYTGNGAGEFNRVTDVDVADFKTLGATKSDWRLVQQGPVCSVFESTKATKNANIIQRITVYHSIKKIDVDVTLENFNGEHNRQYRVMFPVDMTTASSCINYEVPMGVAQVGRDEMKSTPRGWSWGGTYVHHPADTHPREVINFISANGNGFGLTMSSCVSVCDWVDPARESAEYPVLQGILLSSHKSCHGEGNWYHQTGTHNFSFSLYSHNEGWTNGYQQGVAANHPLKVVAKSNNGGTLPEQNSFVEVSDPLVSVTTIKRADNDPNSIIVRLVEMEGKDKSVRIRMPFDAKRIVRTSLIEEDQQPIAGSGQEFEVKLGHHAIETFRVELN